MLICGNHCANLQIATDSKNNPKSQRVAAQCKKSEEIFVDILPRADSTATEWHFIGVLVIKFCGFIDGNGMPTRVARGGARVIAPVWLSVGVAWGIS